jgi:hypothetical protein
LNPPNSPAVLIHWRALIELLGLMPAPRREALCSLRFPVVSSRSGSSGEPPAVKPEEPMDWSHEGKGTGGSVGRVSADHREPEATQCFPPWGRHEPQQLYEGSPVYQNSWRVRGFKENSEGISHPLTLHTSLIAATSTGFTLWPSSSGGSVGRVPAEWQRGPSQVSATRDGGFPVPRPVPLFSLKPVPSPHLVGGPFSASGETCPDAYVNP